MPLGLFTLYTDRLESSEVDGALIKEFDAGGGPLCLYVGGIGNDLGGCGRDLGGFAGNRIMLR